MTADVQSMGTLLSKMTAETSNEVRFDDSQVRAVMEILVPRIVTGLPGLPKGMTCKVDRQDDGWVIHVKKP